MYKIKQIQTLEYSQYKELQYVSAADRHWSTLDISWSTTLSNPYEENTSADFLRQSAKPSLKPNQRRSQESVKDSVNTRDHDGVQAQVSRTEQAHARQHKQASHYG